MADNFNIADLNAQMQMLQSKMEQLDKMKQQVVQTTTSTNTERSVAQTSTYPKVFRTDSVEDILNNPQWKQELVVEFNESELGVKAKNYTELLFMEFCEKQTGKPSTMLTEMRKKAQEQEKKSKPGPKVEEAKG